MNDLTTLIVVCAAITAACCLPLTVIASTVAPTASPASDGHGLRTIGMLTGCFAAALCLGATAAARLGLRPALPVTIATIAAGTALTVTDLRARRLPDLLIAPIPIVWAATAVATIATHTADATAAVLQAIITGATIAVLSLLLALARAGIGAGDIKLVAVLATVTAWSGLQHLAMFLTLAAGLALLPAVTKLIHTRNLRATIPAGPTLCAAAVIAQLL
ncbi:prepilin peptidase [Actinocatenispora comari]|uniref:Prepilin type IV endopeptidase peptidase domain-containing protein n=1 Tax=Actinocatenispora comari TaxID=2807577 RepID=A0A8J4AIG8_9ACTN|nr:prepilin peptidase [Actinocatenispora comari]GIL32066.1 hypothetical protein NUM_73200 [Actinocatenispora comari]